MVTYFGVFKFGDEGPTVSCMRCSTCRGQPGPKLSSSIKEERTSINVVLATSALLFIQLYGMGKVTNSVELLVHI